MADLRADLAGELIRLDGRPYGFYKDLRGRTYGLGALRLRVRARAG